MSCSSASESPIERSVVAIGSNFRLYGACATEHIGLLGAEVVSRF